jgi:hypothetical protein
MSEPADYREPPRHSKPSRAAAGNARGVPVLAGGAAVVAVALLAAAGLLVRGPGAPGPGSLALAAVAAVVSLGLAAGTAAWAARRRGEAEMATSSSEARAAAAGPRRPDHRVDVFVNLSRRMQSLLYREIQAIDEIESRAEDPDLLKGLFTVDHLATRMRRYTESLAVLGGAVSRRRWSNPVPLDHVLRAAVAETEHYARVTIVPPVPGTLSPDAVADVIHLVAELIENATRFSAPSTQVQLRAGEVTAGLAIEVEDRGLGMDAAKQQWINGILAGPTEADIGDLLGDGRIGIYVISALARRHAIDVELQRNVFGGTQAIIVIPRSVAYTGSQPIVPEPVQPPVLESAELGLEPQAGPPWGPRSAAEAAPAPGGALPRHTLPGGRIEDSGQRPRLPRRSAASYMAAPLRGRPAAAEPGLAPGDGGGPDPGLMAAFRDGYRRAEGSGAPETSGRTDRRDAPLGKESRPR